MSTETNHYIGQTVSAETSHFVGRLGGNQAFALDRNDVSNAAILHNVPDAAPYMTLAEQFDLRGLRNLGLWKAGLVEGVGSLLLVFITIFINSSPATIPTPPTAQLGNFDNAAFIGPLVGGITNWFLLTLFIFSFGAVSGGHLNPTITIATFFAQLCSLPRLVLYIGFQTAGAALAGLLAWAALGTRDFKTGGCWLFPDVVSVSAAFVVEIMACMILIFIAFGVGLDPRQARVIGPALSPFLVGLTLGTVSFGTGFARYGYGGASLNPARCFGAFVGSQFPEWHWYHWTAPVIASIVHGVVYRIAPPWQKAA